jgi:RNA-binding protein
MCAETNDPAGFEPGQTLDGRTRRSLMRRANELSPRVFIGRRGVTDGIVAQVRQLFEKTDLIKARVQTDETTDAETAADELSRRVPCHSVGRVGRTITLCRIMEDEG